MAAILKYIQPKLHALSNGLFANWLPEAAVSVGDYGVLKDGGFERLGSLRDFGARIDAQPATIDAQAAAPGKNELEFKDKIDWSVNAMAEATVPANQGVKVSVKIKGKGAFLYHLFDVRQIRPVDQRIFEDEVAKVLISSSLVLPEGAVLVTEVQLAAKATIIASDHSEGSLELATNFKPTGSAFLSGGKGTISVGVSLGSIFSWIARSDTVTLLRLVRPKIPPPSGPGEAAAAGSLQAVLTWAQNLFKARQLSVSELVIRPRPASSDVVVVAIGKDELRLSFSEVTLDELMMTVTDAIAEEVDEEPIELEIREQEFGKRRMTG
jgi:hypothetical protein